MKDSIKEKMAVLRFVTPIMIAIIGFLGNKTINNIEKSIEEIKVQTVCNKKQMDNYFVEHSSDHKKIEVLYEGRLSAVETCLRNIEKRRF